MVSKHLYGRYWTSVLFATVFLVMCAHPGVAQDDTDEWGLGIISRVDTPIKSEIIDFPVGSTKVYDEPKGSCVGEITKDEEYSPHYYNVFLVPGIKSDSSAVKREDLREVTYEGACLKYYEVEDGYVKVLQYTFDDGVWIAIDDLKEDGFAPLSWTDYLLKKKSGFFPRKGYTLKLKENPSSGSKTIIEMQGDAFLIDFTGKYDGGWFEVQVSRFSQYYLSVSEEIPQLYFGWILVLDDQAHPVVWYYTRGC